MIFKTLWLELLVTANPDSSFAGKTLPKGEGPTLVFSRDLIIVFLLAGRDVLSSTEGSSACWERNRWNL